MVLTMKSTIATIAILALLGLGVGVIATAATESNVTATVTVQNISVSVADGNVTFGTLGLDTPKDTTSSGVDETQIATNDGNITETFNIKGDDSGTSWTLGSNAGNEIYANDFCITDCDGTPVWVELSTSYVELKAGVASSGTQDFDLRINTPTVTSVFTEQTIGVVVQATS